jgi:hypothetical protein
MRVVGVGSSNDSFRAVSLMHDHGGHGVAGHGSPTDTVTWRPGTCRETTPELRPAAGAVRDVGVIIVAAGSGTRIGSAELKQFRWVAGKPMLLHSLQAFHRRADVAQVVAVLPRSAAGDPPPWIFQCDVDRLLVSVGGRARGDSVWNGIGMMEVESSWCTRGPPRSPTRPSMPSSAGALDRRGRELPVVDTLKVDARTHRAHGARDPGGRRPAGVSARHAGARVPRRRAGISATDDAACANDRLRGRSRGASARSRRRRRLPRRRHRPAAGMNTGPFGPFWREARH